MKLKILFLLSVLFIGCTTKNKKLDSSSIINSDSTSIWIRTAKNDKTLSKSNRLQLLDKASVLIQKYPNNSTKTTSLSQLALAYKRLGDSISFRKQNTELIQLSKKNNDYKSHGEAHWDLGAYFRQNKPDSAIYHYKEAYQLFLKADLDSASKSYPGRMLYAMASIKDNNKDYISAEKDVVKAIQFFIKNKIDDRLFSAYNLLAIMQNGMGKYDKSLEYHKKAKEFIKYSKNNLKYNQEVININNMASTNLRKGDYTKAISFYENLLQFDNLLQKNTKLYAKGLSGLAYTKLKNGNTNYTELSKQFLNSNRILDSINNDTDKARNYGYYAELLQKQGNITLAIKNALAAKHIAETSSNNDRLLSSLKLLTNVDTKNSAQHAKAYFTLTERLQVQERAIQDKFARIEFETEEVIGENVSLAKQRKTLVGISIALLLLGLGTFIIINQRTNNQKLRFQQTQQENNQEIYSLMLSQQGKFQEGKQLEQKRISEEIHDGILGQMLGIRLILSGLNERSDDSAIKQRAELIEKFRELEEEIRTISHELNNAAYKKINNYIVSIKDLVNTVSNSSKINIKFEFTDSYDWDILNGDIKINTYRIIQECLQNCIKHAKCKNITVNLSVNKNVIFLNIIDDGIGFNVKKGRKGIGHKNITSRIEKICGELKINSNLGEGTEIWIKVPSDVFNEEKKIPSSYKETKTIKA